MKTILRLLGFLKPYWKEVALSILIGTATICTGIGMMGTSAYLISMAALHPSIADLQVAIVGVRFFGISRGVFRYLERLVSHSVNLKVLTRLRVWFYENVEKRTPFGLQMDRGGELLNRVMADLEVLENFFVRVVSPIVVALIITTGMSFFIGGYFFEIGIILAIGMTVNGLVLPAASILLTRKRGDQLQRARADLSADMLEYFQGIEDLLAAGAESRWYEKLEEGSNRVGAHQRYYGFLTGLNDGLTLLVVNLTLLFVLLAAIPRVTGGQMSGVSLAVVSLLTIASFEATNNLPQAAQNLTASIASARRLFSIVAGSYSKAGQKPLFPQSVLQNVHKIEISELEFAYSEEEEQVIHPLNLTIVKNKVTALVGPSGAGKSTLINLLLQFIHYDKGSIKVDGLELAEYEADSTRKLFSVVSQNSFLFADSLRNNLLLACPEATDEQLISAVEAAEMREWFDTLPYGLDTWLGEQGARLSGGEVQRLAIARALLQNAPFILLDEPSGHLDTENEKKIMHTLFDLFKEKGVLLITHRLISLDRVDEIIFLSNGRVVERGSETELLARNGAYKRYSQYLGNQIPQD
jgi:ATP-binding cassette subfamily C protein CydC